MTQLSSFQFSFQQHDYQKKQMFSGLKNFFNTSAKATSIFGNTQSPGFFESFAMFEQNFSNNNIYNFNFEGNNQNDFLANMNVISAITQDYNNGYSQVPQNFMPYSPDDQPPPGYILWPPIDCPPPPPPFINPNDQQLSPLEMKDMLRKIGGGDEEISMEELKGALQNPKKFGLTLDQIKIAQKLVKTLETMQGSGVYGDNAKINMDLLKNLAKADGNGWSLSLGDLEKNNGVWNSSATNNDGQLGINEIFANNGDGNFNASGFFGYVSKGDGTISEEDLKDRLQNGILSPDEKKIAEALLKYIEAKKAAGEPATISAEELKNLMSADPNGSNTSLTVSDIEAATKKLGPNTDDQKLDKTEMQEMLVKIGGGDESITLEELEGALKNPEKFGLTKDQILMAQQLLQTLKTMKGAGVFGETPVINMELLENLAKADGDGNSLSLEDLAKNNGVWNSSGTNNDGQLGINELFANNGNGTFNSQGFFGYLSKGDGTISEADLRDRLRNGTLSPDEIKISKALLKYMQGKKAAGQAADISASELKNMMSADQNGSNTSLTVSDIKAATANLDPKKAERKLTNYMKQHFSELDLNKDGFLSPQEIQMAGLKSGTPGAAQTFINNLGLGNTGQNYGIGLIFESIDPGAAAWGGVSINDLNEIIAEQQMGKSLPQIAQQKF